MITLSKRQMAKILLISILLGIIIGSCRAEEIDINKIIQIESSGNPHAYNKRSGAIGLMQITPICLEEWNNPEILRKRGESRNTVFLVDLYCGAINVYIGTWYINERIPQMLKAYGLEDTIEYRLIAYNWGIGNLLKHLKGKYPLPKETRDYIRKYKEIK